MLIDKKVSICLVLLGIFSNEVFFNCWVYMLLFVILILSYWKFNMLWNFENNVDINLL